MAKYVFVTGGVVSGLGKGITAASLGRLLKARGYRVRMQKLDPYLNIDPGTMNPIQHGEVFVTDDGTETDLDLGHYERFIDENLDRNSNVTSGKVYWSVISRERRGEYGGGTVQVIPHVTEEIKGRLIKEDEADVAIIEVGGTVGDIESQAFYEAIRQFMQEKGPGNSCMIHVTLVPYLYGSGEMKTKPTQASVRELQQMGIRADIIVCRCDQELPEDLKEKIALFGSIPVSHVLQNRNADSIYEVPLMLEEEHFAQAVCECLDLPCGEPDLAEWREMTGRMRSPSRRLSIALVGKYTKLHDAYLSVAEALHHAGAAAGCQVDVIWTDSEEIERHGADHFLSGADGVIIPGGFGSRGIEGMIMAASCCRERGIPILGICLGMQVMMISFARDVLGLQDASSAEFCPETPHPVIDLMPEQQGVTQLGGTMRLGAYPCVLSPGSQVRALYGAAEISERHRHRYEVNNDYREAFEAAGLSLSGKSPDGRIVEMCELPGHPFYVATQAHPEFKSRPNRPHPLFAGLIGAAAQKADKELRDGKL